MALEFEKLTGAVEEMARFAGQKRQQQQQSLSAALAQLETYATAWDRLDDLLDRVISLADEKHYRSARPLKRSQRLDKGREPSPCPPAALLVACDGSQIVPDRHAPFLYYLINVGVIVYAHGSGRPPETQTYPTLHYPGDATLDEEDGFLLSNSLVGLWRDQAEIEVLAETVAGVAGGDQPALGIVDQRLLYWPAGSFPGREGHRVVEAWQTSMSRVRQAGGLLAGYIDRPGKRSVLTMLRSLDLDQDGFELESLYGRSAYAGLTDTELFTEVLQPGERSAVFVDVSQHNNTFRARDPLNEVCFFYLRSGPGLARVDLPRWVAVDEVAVDAIHALIYDQCRILGAYPYVITRADELAVVGRRDQEELESRITLRLAQNGIEVESTAKQQSKLLARSGKSRHGGI
jgi:hypothetical protein